MMKNKGGILLTIAMLSAFSATQVIATTTTAPVEKKEEPKVQTLQDAVQTSEPKKEDPKVDAKKEDLKKDETKKEDKKEEVKANKQTTMEWLKSFFVSKPAYENTEEGKKFHKQLLQLLGNKEALDSIVRGEINDGGVKAGEYSNHQINFYDKQNMSKEDINKTCGELDNEAKNNYQTNLMVNRLIGSSKIGQAAEVDKAKITKENAPIDSKFDTESNNLFKDIQLAQRENRYTDLRTLSAQLHKINYEAEQAKAKNKKQYADLQKEQEGSFMAFVKFAQNKLGGLNKKVAEFNEKVGANQAAK